MDRRQRLARSAVRKMAGSVPSRFRHRARGRWQRRLCAGGTAPSVSVASPCRAGEGKASCYRSPLLVSGDPMPATRVVPNRGLSTPLSISTRKRMRAVTSPAQKPGPQDRPGKGAKDDRPTVPEHDEGKGASRVVDREDGRTQGTGNQARGRAGKPEIGRRAPSQSPNEGSEGGDREEGDADQAGRPLGAEDHGTPSRGMRHKECRDASRQHGQEQQDDRDQSSAPGPAGPGGSDE